MRTPGPQWTALWVRLVTTGLFLHFGDPGIGLASVVLPLIIGVATTWVPSFELPLAVYLGAALVLAAGQQLVRLLAMLFADRAGTRPGGRFPPGDRRLPPRPAGFLNRTGAPPPPAR